MGSLRFSLLAGLTVLLGFVTTPASAQDAFDAPAHIAYADGRVVLEREGEVSDATYGLPFLPGDRLYTQGGRAEVLFPDGTILHVDDRSSVELLAETLLRLTDGRLLLVVAGSADPGRALQYQVDTPAASAFTDGPGEYRVSMISTPSGVQTELSVVRGYGTITTDLGAVGLRAGQRSQARDGASPAYAQSFNSARFDDFDVWSLARRGERVTRSLSSQYLPSDLRGYGSTFDRHGRWEYEASYGYVWYPTVAAGWRPYHHGYWASYPRYGWTWIGLDPWGWPTHHYGRWGYKHSRWYWIPGRVWGPAWVHWVGASSYVGWSPLGWDNRPVFAFAFGTPHVWASWVVVPRTSFGVRHHYVHRYSVPYDRIPRGTTFATYASSPVAPLHRDASVRRAPDQRFAVARVQPQGRAGAPAAAGSYAVPRTGAVRRSGTGPGAAAREPADRTQIEPGRSTAVPRSAVRQAPAPGARTSPSPVSPTPREERPPSAVRRGGPAPARQAAPPPSRVTPRPDERAAPPAPSEPPASGGVARPRSAVRAAPDRGQPSPRSPQYGGAAAAPRSAAQPRASSAPEASGATAGAGDRAPRGETGAARRRAR